MKLILRGCRFLDSPDTALASMLKGASVLTARGSTNGAPV